jgi:hypothetical protein
MTDQQGKLCSPHIGNLSTYFLERAKYYRFAAAMTENAHEIERLCEVAHMFERMAHDTRRLAWHSRWPGRGRRVNVP